VFTTWYRESRSDRHAEYLRCLHQNLNCEALDEVCVFDEQSGTLPAHPRLSVRTVSQRPTYAQFFDWINQTSGAEDWSIIANTDICFDRSLVMLKNLSVTSRQVFALSRWDVLPDGSCRLFDRGDSQDSWFFRGPVCDVQGNFPLGVYDCDNKIAWELQQAGYEVINPALSLRSYHHHQCGYRSYEEKTAPDYGIRPPFLYVEPDNLWGILTALQVRRQANLPYLPWCMTAARFWRYSLPSLVRRVWKRGLGCFSK
jgi:hypothetical protein